MAAAARISGRRRTVLLKARTGLLRDHFRGATAFWLSPVGGRATLWSATALGGPTGTRPSGFPPGAGPSDRILFAVHWPFVVNKPAVEWNTAVSVRDKVKDPERQRLAPSIHERRLRRQPDCRRTLPLATLDRENAEQLIQRERTGSVQAQ